MANPNIVNVSTIYGKTEGLAITTSETAIVSNASSSGKIYKINSLTISNVDGTVAALVTCNVNLNGTDYNLANTISVPADATLVLIGKDNPIYLEENSSIKLTANASSDLVGICSYEDIS
jgi:hypothetical protein